jgi:hypothetical protein
VLRPQERAHGSRSRRSRCRWCAPKAMGCSQIATTVAMTPGVQRSTPVPSRSGEVPGPAISLRAVARKIVVEQQTVTPRHRA